MSSCGDPCCPGWVVSDGLHPERCDDCSTLDHPGKPGQFEDDAAAWDFIQRASSHRVLATRQTYDDGTPIPDHEGGAVRGEMQGADPHSLWEAYRLATARWRASLLGAEIPANATVQVAVACLEQWEVVD